MCFCWSGVIQYSHVTFQQVQQPPQGLRLAWLVSAGVAKSGGMMALAVFWQQLPVAQGCVMHGFVLRSEQQMACGATGRAYTCTVSHVCGLP